ncbi:amino acid transporter domain protein [Rhodococcus sp. MTM3W5.2]|nr:amino acid transporter domain protein [Rhodococcus sp. MTM3W5.2]
MLTVRSAAIPNSIAAILLDIRDRTGTVPHVYFEWTEGNPVRNLLQFLFFGHGEVASVTREVLRRAEPDVARRPHVHVG